MSDINSHSPGITHGTQGVMPEGIAVVWSSDPPVYNPPYLSAEPFSPNTKFTSIPMVWIVRDDEGSGSIELLTLNGTIAIIDNVVQTGFTGTVVANAYGGFDVSIVADLDYWEEDYIIEWSILMTDGTISDTETGTIIKYVSLPVGVYVPPKEATFFRNLALPLQFTEDCDVLMSNDEQAIKNNMKTSVLMLRNGIPLDDSGSDVPLLVFSPGDRVTAARIRKEITRAISEGEPRVEVDPNVVFEEANNKMVAIVHYKQNRIVDERIDYSLGIPIQDVE